MKLGFRLGLFLSSSLTFLDKDFPKEDWFVDLVLLISFPVMLHKENPNLLHKEKKEKKIPFGYS